MIITTPSSGPDVELEVTPTLDQQHFGYLLVDADANVWDLVAGPVVVQAGIQGLGLPDPTHWTDESAAVDGARHRGMRTGPRPIVLPVRLSSRTADGARQVDSDFGNAIAPENLCSLVVVAPDSTWRSIGIRYDTGGAGDFTTDLLLARYATYPLEFTANDPWYHTQEVVEVISNSAAANLFPGPPFAIGSANTIGSAVTTNPGDKPAWPRWIIQGPFTGATVGVGTAVVALTLAKLAGEWVEIDMDPNRRVIVDNTGADVRTSVTDVTFAPIPPGLVPLTVNVAGAATGTQVELHYVPNYRRAW